MSEDIAHPFFSTRPYSVTGSVGVLVSGIRRGAIDINTANEWPTEWREKRGYYAPVERVEDVLP